MNEFLCHSFYHWDTAKQTKIMLPMISRIREAIFKVLAQFIAYRFLLETNNVLKSEYCYNFIGLSINNTPNKIFMVQLDYCWILNT